MLALVLGTLVALGLAVAVFVVASVASSTGRVPHDGPGGPRAYLADVRSGVRAVRHHRRDGAPTVGTAEPVDTTLGELLATTTVQDPAYLAVEDLTDTLARARERASRGVHGLARR
jgi:hypothetical protein